VGVRLIAYLSIVAEGQRDKMIHVKNLTKKYGGFVAISDLNFHVGRGEIVGLLGPNGSGKSTTLRILSTYMAATYGSVQIDGLDLFDDAAEIRKRIGYMPENNPLYSDMRVREYLKFRAQLKGLTYQQSRTRVDQILSECGIEDAQHKLIGTLSLGYRQRVGIADALVHNPDLVILDEPTLGLDPNQIRSIRQLIKDLAGKHTVLISSHILHEIEMTCTRVLILQRGRIIASDDTQHLQNLIALNPHVMAEIKAPLDALSNAWKAFTNVESVDISSSNGDYYRCVIAFRNDSKDPREIVFSLVKQNNWELRELTMNRPSLEDAFVQLTRQNEKSY